MTTYAARSSSPPLTFSRLLEIEALLERQSRIREFETLFQSRLDAERWILEAPVVIHPRIYRKLLELCALCAISRRLRCRVIRGTPRLTLGHLASHEEGLYG